MKWWYVQRYYDNIYNMMVMIYLQWVYDEVMMMITDENIFTRHWWYEWWGILDSMWWIYTLNNILNFYLPPPLVTRRFLLMGFLVMPKDIRIEKRFTAEWAHQPHSKVHFPHMGTNGYLWGWWALFAAINLALIDSFGTPQLKSWGLHICQ